MLNVIKKIKLFSLQKCRPQYPELECVQRTSQEYVMLESTCLVGFGLRPRC